MNEDEHGIRGQDDHGGPGWEEAMDEAPGLSGTQSAKLVNASESSSLAAGEDWR